jgi:polar amino acid transport system substrate-binding protein
VPRRIIAVLATGLAITATLAGCSSTGGDTAATSSGSASASATKTLTLATDAQYPPCESIDPKTKKMVGFEPDLWDAIAEKAGYKLKIENTGFDSLIPGVQSGRYDVAMECISDSLERQKQVSFVDFIYAKNSVITTADYKGAITASDPLSVCGETMGSQTGFDSINSINDVINPKCKDAGKAVVKIQTYPSASATYNALYSGRVDFIIQDTAAASILNESAPVKLTTYENTLLPEYYLGIVFNKDDTELQQEWLTALKAVIADGTYEKVLAKWKLSDIALMEPGINLAESKPLNG